MPLCSLVRTLISTEIQIQHISFFQVTEHLKNAAKNLGVRVVPIVGGMSSAKQERLLKGKPEIVVGTPGRLWELMSVGEKHLVEVCNV